MFDAKTQSPEEIAKILTERMKEIKNIPESIRGTLSQSQAELQRLCKSTIDQLREKHGIGKDKKVKIEIDEDRTIHINFVSEPVKKDNVLIAISRWFWSVISWWIGWLILASFMILPPVLVILAIWIFTATELSSFTILTCFALIALYWLAIFKTQPGQKLFNWIGRISGTH